MPAAPQIILLCRTVAADSTVSGVSDAEPPSLCWLDAWWSALALPPRAAAGAASLAVCAEDYKAVEFWAFHRGLSVADIVNSGRSVGDLRCVLGGGAGAAAADAAARRCAHLLLLHLLLPATASPRRAHETHYDAASSCARCKRR